LVEYKFFKVLVTINLQLIPENLVYGTNPANSNFENKSPVTEAVLTNLGKALNLKQHTYDTKSRGHIDIA
jgi:hypothetical protein